jgi:hypothetical protein
MESLLVPSQERPPSQRPRSPTSLALQQPQRSPTSSGTAPPTRIGSEAEHRRRLRPSRRSQNRRPATLRQAGTAAFSTILLLRRVLDKSLRRFFDVAAAELEPRKHIHRPVRRRGHGHILVRSRPNLATATVLISGHNVPNIRIKCPASLFI